jgi:hypothetical protein
MIDTVGVRLVKSNKAGRSPEAREVRHVYRAWVKHEGLESGRPYVMGLFRLYGQMSHFMPDGSEITDRAEYFEAARRARRVIVHALNDTHGGIELVLRPHRTRAA